MSTPAQDRQWVTAPPVLTPDVRLKRLNIRPTGVHGLAWFENSSVAAFMHHNETLLTVRNASSHYCGVIDVIMAGAKDRIRRVSVHKAVNFQCGRPAVKSYSLGVPATTVTTGPAPGALKSLARSPPFR